MTSAGEPLPPKLKPLTRKSLSPGPISPGAIFIVFFLIVAILFLILAIVGIVWMFNHGWTLAAVGTTVGLIGFLYLFSRQ